MVTFRRAYRCLYRESSFSFSLSFSLSTLRFHAAGEDPFPVAATTTAVVIVVVVLVGEACRGIRSSGVGIGIRDGGRVYSSSHREAARVESPRGFIFHCSQTACAISGRMPNREKRRARTRASRIDETEQSQDEQAAEKADYFIAWDSPWRGAPLLAFFEPTN